MLSAQYLGPSNYGLISYVASVVAFVVPIMQLGLRSTVVSELIETPEEEGRVMGTTLGMALLSAVACMAGVISFVSISSAGERDTVIVCALYSVNLILQAVELLQYWFQAKLLAKYTSIVSLVAYVVATGYKIFLLVTEKSVYWFALSNAVDYLVIAVALIIIYRRLSPQPLRFSPKMVGRLWRKSKYYVIPGLMVSIFQQTDRVMLKLMIDDAATGIYSAAVTVATITAFVFSAIIDSMRPVILEEKHKNTPEYEERVSGLFSITFYLSLLQSVFMTLLAGPIISILYGEAYAASADALRIVVWYTTFSYFGSARNVWILAEGRQKHLWLINLLGAALNVGLNLILIPKMGVLGAAVASLATQFFANFILSFILPPIRGVCRLMLRGMRPDFAIGQLRLLLKREK